MSDGVTNRCRIGRLVDFLSYIPIKRLRPGFPDLSELIVDASAYVRFSQKRSVWPNDDILNEHVGSSPIETILSGFNPNWKVPLVRLRSIAAGPLMFLDIPVDEIQGKWQRLQYVGRQLTPQRGTHHAPSWGVDAVEWLLQNSLPMADDLVDVVIAATTAWDLDAQLGRELIYKEWKDGEERSRSSVVGEHGTSDAGGARVNDAQVPDHGEPKGRDGAALH